MEAVKSRNQKAEADDSVIMPTAPPREIAANYQWKLLLSDSWAVAAAVFLFTGLIFFFVGVPLTLGVVTAFVGIPFALLGAGFLAGGGYVIYWRYNEAVRTAQILRIGEATVGEITGLSENYNVQINGRNPWKISYQFTYNGQQYEKSLTTLASPGARFEQGRKICVLHLPDAPEYNTLYPHP